MVVAHSLVGGIIKMSAIESVFSLLDAPKGKSFKKSTKQTRGYAPL